MIACAILITNFLSCSLDWLYILPFEDSSFYLKAVLFNGCFSVAMKKHSMQDNFIKWKKLIWLKVWEVQKHGTVINWDLLRTHHREHHSGQSVVCQGEIILPNKKLEHSICFLLQSAFQESKASNSVGGKFFPWPKDLQLNPTCKGSSYEARKVLITSLITWTWSLKSTQ